MSFCSIIEGIFVLFLLLFPSFNSTSAVGFDKTPGDSTRWNENPQNFKPDSSNTPLYKYGPEAPPWEPQRPPYPQHRMQDGPPVRNSFEEGPMEREEVAPVPSVLKGNDQIAEYVQTLGGRVLLTGTSGFAGVFLGLVFSNVMINQPVICAVAGLIFAVVLSFIRGLPGDVVRSAGLALILAVSRSRKFRHGYPVFSQLKSVMRIGVRRPFPPGAENPWQYKPRKIDDVEFEMSKALPACAFLGLFCGWSLGKSINFILLPTWLLSLGGLGSAIYFTNLQNSIGDFFRCLGMKIAAFFGLLIEVDGELNVSVKVMALLRAFVKKLMFFDRKFKITDKLFDFLQRLWAQLVGAFGQMQSSMNEQQRSSSAPKGRREPSGWQQAGAGDVDDTKRFDKQSTDPWADGYSKYRENDSQGYNNRNGQW